MVCCVAGARRAFPLPRVEAAPRGGAEPAPHAWCRGGEDAPPLLAEVVGGIREAGGGVPIGLHEVPRLRDERLEQRLDELAVAIPLEVLPEGPDHEGGLVLLDGKLRLAVLHPRVPRRGEGAVRVVLVEVVALLADDVLAEEVEPLGDVEEYGPVAGVGDEGAVPRAYGGAG